MTKHHQIPPMVRILPMDRVYEFDDMDVEEVQEDFFLNRLPDNGNGKYLYRKRGINAPKGTVVLFQYDNNIIASARLIKTEEFSQPVHNDYYGAYYFEPDSIVIFDPVSDNEIRQIWGSSYVDSNGTKRTGFKRFSHTKAFLDPTQYSKFLQLTKAKRPIFFKGSPSITSRKYGSGGEGRDHKQLKIWLSRNPGKLGLKNIIDVEVEHKFLSGDAADIVFTHRNNKYTIVEVETNNPLPGAHQAIKYRALLCAEKQLPLDASGVKAILVAWSIPKAVKIFCKNYGIDFQTHKK